MDWSDEETWRRRAACRPPMDTNIFFPMRGEYDKEHQAKRICAMCPVTKECLAYALSQYNCSGIWGGTSHKERKRMTSRVKLVQKSLRA